MATNINLVTYSGSMVSPLDDAIVYETAIAESGIIYGGNLTIKNVNTIHINAGHGIVCGRKFTITDSDISVQLTSGAQELGRIYLHLDLANTTEPIQILTEIGATLTPVIQQTDVNINNGIYEINLATFNIDSMTITDLVEVFPTVSNPIGYLSDLDTTNKNSIVDAINEVNSKEVSVLDTGEEIMANTTPGKAAGANGVKELITEVNDSLGGMQFGIDENGNYGYIKDGADTVTPFNDKIIKTTSLSMINGSTKNINFSDVITNPSDYTASDFVVYPNYVHPVNTSDGHMTVQFTLTYNNSTGVVTVKTSSVNLSSTNTNNSLSSAAVVLTVK